jgi:hypothetical protein
MVENKIGDGVEMEYGTQKEAWTDEECYAQWVDRFRAHHFCSLIVFTFWWIVV